MSLFYSGFLCVFLIRKRTQFYRTKSTCFR